MIDRIRTFIGYREYPKYHMISRYFVYKQALLHEAEQLVRAGVLREREDIFFLSLRRSPTSSRRDQLDDELISARKDAFEAYRALTPPRVITSDGEIITGTYRRDDVPAGALVGLPVSAGTVEGRARVVLDMAETDSRPATSWSPPTPTRAGRPFRGDRGPGDGSRRSHDARRRDCPRVRPACRRRGRARH